MIIKPPIERNTTVTFRVVSGETVVARFLERTSTHLVITKPICAHLTPTENGLGISFAPFCPTADVAEEFRIPHASVLMEPVQPTDDIKSSYIKMTTGLDIG